MSAITTVEKVGELLMARQQAMQFLHEPVPYSLCLLIVSVSSDRSSNASISCTLSSSSGSCVW